MASFDAGSGGSTAATGAGLGPAIFPGIGTAVGAAVGFLWGGFAGGRAKAREARRKRKLEERIRFVTSPENFNAVFTQLTPLFRATIAQPIGAAVESATATENARRGLTGTGIGSARRAAPAGGRGPTPP